MDNLTHALAGCLAAEVLVSVRRRTRSRAQEPERWATTAYVLSAVANNLPDLDILYLGITEGKIGYLVHHRGHTHTLVVAALLGLLSWAMVWAGRHRLAREERPWSARDGGDLLLLAVGGTFLHMAMDFTNNYGVHPFWPVDRRWFYGDTIFIVEPMLWASVAPVLFFSVSHRAARVLFGSLSVLGVVATWASGFVAWPLAIGVTGWTAFVGAAAAGARPGRRVVVALAACVSVYATFIAGRREAERRIQAATLAGESMVAVAIAPLPANPFCWGANGIFVRDDRLVVRRGRVSLAPSLDRYCRQPFTSPTAPLIALDEEPEASMHWEGELIFSRRAFLEAAHTCRGAAFLMWSRIPFLAGGASPKVLGDLRYDFEPELGWAEISLDPAAPCPAWLPDWTPPRTDLISNPW